VAVLDDEVAASTRKTPISRARKECSKYAELWMPGVSTTATGFSLARDAHSSVSSSRRG